MKKSKDMSTGKSHGQFIKNRRSVLIALSAAIVFVTTYILILPAITLDQESASEQGGIDVPAAEQQLQDVSQSQEDPAPGSVTDPDTDTASEFASDPAPEAASEPASKPAAGQLLHEGEGFSLSAAYGAKAGLPENTELTVEEITEKDKDYQAWYDETLKALQESRGGSNINKLKLAKFYDITLTADGEALQPQVPVDLTITYDKALKVKDADHVRIVHFAADEDGKLIPEVLDPDKVELTIDKKKMSEAAFAADSFSMYALVCTKEEITEETLSADGGDYTIRVAYGEEAEIPEGAELKVREIEAKTDEFEEYLKSSAGELSVDMDEISFARFFDIEIEKDGEKIEPLAPVQVQITYEDVLEVGKSEELNVVHFAAGGTEVIDEVALAEGEKEISYEQSSFSVTGTIINDNGHPEQQNEYVVVVKHDGEYYAVRADGSLQKVTYSEQQNVARVSTEFPMTWTYRSAQNNPYYEPYVLRMAAEAANFDGNELPTMYSYLYIDPNTDGGIREEEIYGRGNVQNLAWDCELRYEQSDHSIHGTYMDTSGGGYAYPNNGKYIGVSSEGGKLHIVGNRAEADKAEIYLARITTVPEPYGTGNTVNHIDISVKGAVDINVPLAYGTYYYYDDNGDVQTLTVTADQPVISKITNYPVAVKKEDMMKADLFTYRKNADGTITDLDDMFYVTGYSDNGKADGTTGPDQVRIEGSFKVSYTNVPGQNGNDYSRNARKATPVWYSISAPKDVTVPLQYTVGEGEDAKIYPLYAHNPEETGEDPLTTNATVTMTADFTFWDFTNNRCPAAMYNLGGDWHAGDIPDGLPEDKFHSGSGMDFEINSNTSSSAHVYAVEITKMVVDENGNRIRSNNTGTSKFHIYRKGDAENQSQLNDLSDSVKDLNVGSATQSPDYSGFIDQHDNKEIFIGQDGLGMTYEYDVQPGLYYIAEDPDSIEDTITDTSGKEWNYKETYFLTEYAWRNHPNDNKMHVSESFAGKTGSYSSVPEILGEHPSYDRTESFTNDFLEFYVYNVYESPKVDVPVEKTWHDFDDEDHENYDWSATFKLQWAPLYEGETTPSESFEDVVPLQEITITKDQMKDENARAESLEDRTFKDLPKYGTDKNGNTFRYQYSLEETSYQVTSKTTGVVVYSWSETDGYNTDDEDEHYQPFYPHDAGEESEDDDDYYIQVRNAKRNIREKEYIDVSLDKQWDESFDERDDSYYAEFELRRFVHTEYRDISHMSDADRDPERAVTVTIKNSNGDVIDSLQVQPNVGVYLAGNFKPHDSAKTVEFTTDTPVRLPSGSHVSTITATAEGSNQSNALVRSPEFFVTQDTVFTLTSGEGNLVEEGKIARVLDTSAGTNPLPDRNFSRTIRLDSSNNWHVDLNDLIRSETSAGDDDDNENVTLYEYYFVEKASSPKGYARYFRAGQDGQPTEILSGDSDHQIEDNDSIIAVNGPANVLTVEKKWRGVPNATGFPHVTFTLYQTWADGGNISTNNGWVYENETTHDRYEHIELPANSLTWNCPEVLPTTRIDGGRSRQVAYYVQEDVQSGSQTNDGITTRWQFYYYINSNDKQTNAGHQGYFAGLTGASLANDGGTITICNKMNEYMQMDIQKQFFELGDAGSWANITAQMRQDAILGFRVIRAVRTADGKWLDEHGRETDAPVWMDYGNEMLCGYQNGQAVVQRDPEDNFWLHDAGGEWHFRIEDNQGDANNVNAGGSGLPSYGFYIRNGEDIAVEYWYSVRETNVYRNLNRDPYPEWDWYSSITPVDAYGPRGQVMEAFPKAFHGQDAKRIANFQASDLIIHKDWIGEPASSEVYIKIWRTVDGGQPEDFTQVIADDIKNNHNWQMYLEDESQINVDRAWLILKDDGSGDWTDSLKVNRALLGTLSNADRYRYYIQEVGYKDPQTGRVRTNVNSAFKPLYDKWVGTAEEGDWTGAPVSMNNYESNNISIGAKGENRLKVINRVSPSTSYTIIKAFTGSQGSTGTQSSVTGYPTDGSRQVVVHLQQRYRYEKNEEGVDYVSADNENWVEKNSEEAANTWTVDWQNAESASPSSVVLPLPKPEGSTLSDEAWYGSAAAWTYTWEGLDVKKLMSEAADPEDNVYAQLYYRAVETSTPEWINDTIAAEEQDGHMAVDDQDQSQAQILSEKNTVTNVQGKCDLKLNKEWTGLGEGETWPDGYVVYYQLFQNYHLALTDTSQTGSDGQIDPSYSTGKRFMSVGMQKNSEGSAMADRVHPQATGTLEASNHNLDITELPMYGFLTATAEDVEEAAEAGVTLKEGTVYPVVYTYSVKETAVKKNGTDVTFRPQTVEAERDGTVNDKVLYKATLTNELVEVTVEKEWNGFTPGEDESAKIGLYRFEKEPEPLPETTFPYTVTVRGDADALESDGTVTAIIYNDADEEAGRVVLSGSNEWTHTFDLDVGGTYHAEFSGDGSVLKSEVAPASAENITEEGSTELTAEVKPASGGGDETTTGSFSGGTSSWGVDNWNALHVGQPYTLIFQVDSDPTQYTVSATGVSSMSYDVSNNWGSGGQITVNFVPASADEPVTITASQNGNRSSRSMSAAAQGKKSSGVLLAPLRADAISWINDETTLPQGADPDNDEKVSEVTFSGENWSKTWSELPKYSENGNEYVYYAYELEYTGVSDATAMNTTYSIDEAGKITVTNTPTLPDKGNLEVTKEVFYGSALDKNASGESFTVGIFTDAAGTTRVEGQTDKTINVTNGTGKVTFTDLPAGTYYIYEVVGGAAVTTSGQTATIDGRDYTVTYEGNAAEVASGQTAQSKVINAKQPYDLQLLKIEKTDSSEPETLGGAVFTMNQLAYDPDAAKKISYVPGTEVTVRTEDDGTASFEELAQGYYEIVETIAPAGYVLADDCSFCIRVTSSGISLVIRDDTLPPDQWEEAESDGLVTFNAEEEFLATIENEPGTELPSSGGPGTTWIYLLGMILFIGCSTLLIARRRVTGKGFKA